MSQLPASSSRWARNAGLPHQLTLTTSTSSLKPPWKRTSKVLRATLSSFSVSVHVNIQQSDGRTSSPQDDGMLWRHSGIVNATVARGDSPLHLASSKGDTESVRLVIQHGVDVNARDKRDATPLHLVSSLWDHGTEVVCLLLEYCANAGAKDGLGRTLYEIALSISERHLPRLHG